MGIMINGGLLGLVVILSDYSMFSIDFPIFPWVFHGFSIMKTARNAAFIWWISGRLTPCARNGRHGALGIRCADGGVEWPSMEHGVSAIISWGWMIDVVADLKGMSPNFCCIT